MHSIRFFDRQATPYAFLQPTEQRRPNPRHSSSRREPRPQRFPQRQRRRKTCRIGRRPPRNIVPTRAKLSLLKLCRVQPILCNTAPTAPTLSILSTSERKNFRIETVMLSRQREFCSGCETVCANEGRAELVPAMPSAAKLGALVHKFPFHDSFSLSVSGVS